MATPDTPERNKIKAGGNKSQGTDTKERHEMGKKEERREIGRHNTGKRIRQRRRQEEKKKSKQDKARGHRGCEASCKGWSCRLVQNICVPARALKRTGKMSSRGETGRQGNRTQYSTPRRKKTRARAARQ